MNVPSEIGSIWPYFFTYGGPKIFMFFMTLVVMPVIFLFVIRPLVRPLAKQLLIVLGVWLVAGVFAYWDTFVIARQAGKLCRNAGMKINRTVEAEGFVGASDIALLKDKGFLWLEVSGTRGVDRIELKNGQVVFRRIPKLTARYEFAREREKSMPPCCTEVREVIRDRLDNEILGSITLYIIYPGFLDRKLISTLGFTWTPPRCVQPDTPPSISPKGEIYPREFINSVIRPARD